MANLEQINALRDAILVDAPQHVQPAVNAAFILLAGFLENQAKQTEALIRIAVATELQVQILRGEA